MSKTNFNTCSAFGLKAVKEQLTQGGISASGSEKKSAIDGKLALSQAACKRSNRPQTAVPVPSSKSKHSEKAMSNLNASQRQSIINEAVAKRNSEAHKSAAGSQNSGLPPRAMTAASKASGLRSNAASIAGASQKTTS